MTTPTESGPTLDAASPIPPDIEAADEPTKVPLAIEDWLTVIIMGALALITFANVIVRYFTDSSFAWTEEFSVFLMIMLALVAGSAAVARDRHIRIEYFSESGSMARRKRLAQFGALMIAVLFTLIGALSIRMVWDDYRFEETTPGIGLVFQASPSLSSDGTVVAFISSANLAGNNADGNAEMSVDARLLEMPHENFSVF